VEDFLSPLEIENPLTHFAIPRWRLARREIRAHLTLIKSPASNSSLASKAWDSWPTSGRIAINRLSGRCSQRLKLCQSDVLERDKLSHSATYDSPRWCAMEMKEHSFKYPTTDRESTFVAQALNFA
jgi:hypothetical protein